MKKETLARFIRDTAYLTGQFKLRSGKTSSYYWDKYRFESDPKLLRALISEMLALLPETYNCLAGLELGGVPLVTALSLRTNRPALFVRKAPKVYGTANLIEGCFQRGDVAVVIEDVVTTAGQVCKSVRQIREQGLCVERVVCAIDREQGGRERLESIGCTLHPVFTMSELMELSSQKPAAT